MIIIKGSLAQVNGFQKGPTEILANYIHKALELENIFSFFHRVIETQIEFLGKKEIIVNSSNH